MLESIWKIGIEFLGHLVTGKLPTVFIVLLIVSMLLNLVIEYTFERFQKPDQHILKSIFSLVLEAVIGFLIFTYAFITFLRLADLMPFVNLGTTSAIALGEITLVSYAVYSVLSLPSLLMQYVESTIGISLNFVGQLVIGGLVYYVLLETLPMASDFELPYMTISVVILIILNIILWSISIHVLKEEKDAEVVD